MPGPRIIEYCSFVVNFEMEKCESSNFGFPFQECFGFSESLSIPYEFYDIFHFCQKDKGLHECVNRFAKCLNDIKFPSP